MKFLFAAVALTSLGVLAVIGHSHHGHEAVSYSVVTKHEDNHGHAHGHHGADHGHKHAEHHENYVSHGHQEHHGHHEHHAHHEHKAQHSHHAHHEHGHQIEHHGNNGHDDHHEHHEHHDEHSNPKYDFKYGVKDPKTGDVKQQWESRDSDKVKGSYSLKEADGTTRVVNYSSDKKTGFEATVHKIGHAHHGHQVHHH